MVGRENPAAVAVVQNNVWGQTIGFARGPPKRNGGSPWCATQCRSVTPTDAVFGRETL